MMIADGVRGVGNNPFALLYQFQLAMFSGFWFARYLWRVYPNSMEFFDHGVSIGGTTFLPWQQVELRPSRYFADRMVLVLRPAADSVTAQTRLAQVPDALRVDILSCGRCGVSGG
jgi:hypothetical protein